LSRGAKKEATQHCLATGMYRLYLSTGVSSYACREYSDSSSDNFQILVAGTS